MRTKAGTHINQIASILMSALKKHTFVTQELHARTIPDHTLATAHLDTWVMVSKSAMTSMNVSTMAKIPAFANILASTKWELLNASVTRATN